MIKKLFIFVVLLVLELQSLAQGCSTCRAQIESNNQEDFSVGKGLNIGILFLMVIPYILLFLFFRKKIIGFIKEFIRLPY